VSTTTQGTFLNQVFVGMFRPDAQFSPRWVGNLKQYQLGFDSTGALDLLDADNPPKSAILGDSGFFSPLARSFWTQSDVFFTNLPSGTPPSASDLPDGYVVEKGGAAQWLRRNNIPDSSKRNLYTLPSSPAVDTSLSTFPFKTSTNEVSSAFDPATVLWVRGEANVTDGLGAEEFVGSYSDSGTVKPLGTSGARHSIHGDVLHSRPVAINYGKDASGIDDVVVFYGANDGIFRAVDGRKEGTTAGHELWSFVAPEFYPMLKRQRAGTPLLHLPETDSSGKLTSVPDDAQAKDYGMDGPVGSYVLYNTGATSVKEAIIYMTMRRGGRSVYAFDVTNKTNPKLKWKVEGGVTSGFGALAQTWSMAKPIVYKATSGLPPVVVVMGGGYDPAEDKDETGTPAGNRIYFIDGRTGALLKEVETAYSVPSDVTVVDTAGAGVPNRAYAADVRGNVYRIDLPTSDVLNPTAWSNTKAVNIAELGGKVFYAPDVVVTNKFIVVLVGTGDREKPLLTSKILGSGSTDGFYLIKDTIGAPRSSAVKPSDLALVARVNKDTMKPEPTAELGNEFGCYISLAENGEKVVNAPTTIAGVSYFGTNRPTPKDTLSCKAGLGEAYSYRFPLFCKEPTNTKLETGGLPPSPVAGIVEINVNGKPTQVPFIIGAGKDGSPFKPAKPEPPVPPVRKRQNWYINNANR
jgi:type IV pilus assembly protein PilY1